MDPSEMSASSSHKDSQLARVTELSNKVDLLLAAPYSPSLYRLRSVLERCSLDDVRVWIEHSTYKIQSLVELVIKGLEYDIHATTLVEVLSPHLVFRDSILTAKPSMLSGVLKASLVNEKSLESYSPMAVALLSPPLSEDFLVPAALAPFLILIHQAISVDDTNHLFSLECILRSNASHALPSLSQIQTYNLTSTLANLLGSNETSIVLGALSCLSSIAGYTGDKSDKSTKNSRSLFVEEKGKKVIRLVLSTMSSQMSSENQFDDSKGLMKNVELIINIFKAIDRRTLQEWLQTREGMSSIKKFFDKVQLQTDSALLHIACRYLSLIFSYAIPTVEFKELATRICTHATNMIEHDNYSSQIVETFAAMLPHADPSQVGIEVLLEQILDHKCEADQTQTQWLQRIQYHALTRITDSVCEDTNCRRYVGILLSTEKYANLVAHYTYNVARRKSGNCPRNQKLDQGISRLVLCSLALVSTDIHESYGRNLTNALLDVMTSDIDNYNLRGYRVSEPKDTESFCLREAFSTPHSGSGSHAWKTQLLKDLQNEAQYQHTSMVARVDNICRDLQRRAETNEEPLRESERARLQAQDMIQQLQVQLEEANSELQQRDAENQHVFEERARYESVIANLIREVEISNARVTDGEQLNLSHDATIADLQDNNKQLGTDLQDCQKAIQAQCQLKEAQISELIVKVQVETEQNSRLAVLLQESGEQLRLEHAKVIEHINAHQQDLVEKAALTIHAASLEEELQQEREKVQALDNDLAKRNEEFESKMQKTVEHTNSLEAELTSQKRIVSDLRARLEDTKSLADERLELLAEEHRSSLRTIKDELQLTKNRNDSAIQSLQDENGTLRESLKKIRTNYSRRCEEFEKAQDLSKRLMAVMGGLRDDTSPANPPSPLPRTNQLCEYPAQGLTSTKRSKVRESIAMKNSRRTLSCDMTTDVTFDSPDKENQSPVEEDGSRRKVRKEDSMILSELSGLGL